MTKRIPLLASILIASSLTLAWAAPAAAEQTVEQKEASMVVELFTSQGCSSCPPADALLESYVRRAEVVALSLPVDYWDYLGWKDTFGQAAFSERQRNYARQRGDNMVYTPQVVINGMFHAVGSRRSAIDSQLQRAAKKLADRRLALRVTLDDDDRLTIARSGTATAAPKARRDVVVWLAFASKSGRVEINRGENHGRTVTYHHVVRELKKLGTWSARKDVFVYDNAAMGDGIDGCIVLIQDGPSGPIIGGVELWTDQAS